MRTAKPFTVLNFFAGPGAGKTTSALATTAVLKQRGDEAEFVPEFARELAFEGKLAGYPQAKIFEEQKRRIDRLAGHVDFAVCDSPILMQLAYTDPADKDLRLAITQAAGMWKTINVFVSHDRANHSLVGRLHTADEASLLDLKIQEILAANQIQYKVAPKYAAPLTMLGEVLRA